MTCSQKSGLRKGRLQQILSNSWAWLKWFRTPLLVVIGCSIYSGNESILGHVARAVGATAVVTVAASDLAVQLLNSTSSGVALVSRLTWDITASSLGAIEATWQGVDLLNVSVSRARGRIRADSPQAIAAWLNSSEGRRITTCTENFAQRLWADALWSLSHDIQDIENSIDALELRGSFSRVAFAAQWDPTGEASFKYEYAQVSFSPRWANPFWELLDLPLESEALQVERLLDELVLRVPAAPLLEHRLSDADVPLSAGVLWAIQRLRARRSTYFLCTFIISWCLRWFDWLIRGKGLWILTFALLAAGTYWYGRRLLLWLRSLKLRLQARLHGWIVG